MKIVLKYLRRFIIAIVLGYLSYWVVVKYYAPPIEFPDQIRSAVEATEEFISDSTEKIQKTVKAPPPLRGALTGEFGEDLSISGVLQETNRNRSENGRSALKLNTQLNTAAEAKLADMFDQQYFEHVSPDGRGPSDVAEAAGYEYIAVGENLALGNYENDAELVQAWMDSPGHRENILAKEFTEIGIAVGKGVFEGQTTWLAVQSFGRPLADCPQPSPKLNAEITANKAELEAMKTEADARKAEFDSASDPNNRKEAAAYNEKVNAYNALVKQINALIGEIQGQITVYNGQVRAFNACANN